MTNAKFREKLLGLQQNLLNFAYVLTSNRDDAYDLLQDTTLKVLDSREMYQDDTNFKGWMFTIMRNIFINRYRRMVRSATIVDTSDDLYRINTPENSLQPSPEETYLASEITEVVNTFPDGYRIPFTMHVAGYKYSEIAERMQLPLGTVKSRIFYARKFLQERLSDYRS